MSTWGVVASFHRAELSGWIREMISWYCGGCDREGRKLFLSCILYHHGYENHEGFH